MAWGFVKFHKSTLLVTMKWSSGKLALVSYRNSYLQVTNVQAISHNILCLFVLVADVNVLVKRTEQSKPLTILMLLELFVK